MMTWAPIAQSAEADDLKSFQSGFESLWGYICQSALIAYLAGI